MSRKHGRPGALRMALLDFEEERNKSNPNPIRLLEIQANLKALGHIVGFSSINEVRLVEDPRKVI